ncbi:MAG: hypothetical protein P9L99_06980 [Candidatus Lernaella stagnicola]|nr:hypothetical protein [Candidatus Lernaella stagnicola]
MGEAVTGQATATRLRAREIIEAAVANRQLMILESSDGTVGEDAFLVVDAASPAEYRALCESRNADLWIDCLRQAEAISTLDEAFHLRAQADAESYPKGLSPAQPEEQPARYATGDWPSWYHGFNSATSVSLTVQSEAGFELSLRVGRLAKTRPLIGKRFSRSEAGVFDLEFSLAEEPPFAAYLGPNQGDKWLQYQPLIHPPEIARWGLINDAVECLSVDALAGRFRIIHMRVILNRHEALNKSVNISLRAGESRDLSRTLERAKRAQLEIEDESIHPILLIAAQHLYEAWSRRYGNVWAWAKCRPMMWCTEFAAYCIRQGTNNYLGGALCQVQDLYHNDGEYFSIPYDYSSNLKTGSVRHFFEERARFISPLPYNSSDGMISKKVPESDYDQLGELVRPGFYVRIKQGGHSTIFIRWNTPPPFPRNPEHRPPINGFYPDLNENTFLAIGGNQGTRHCVSVQTFSVSLADTTADVYWAEILGDNADKYDGFGDTSGIFMETSHGPMSAPTTSFDPFDVALKIPNVQYTTRILREVLAILELVGL